METKRNFYGAALEELPLLPRLLMRELAPPENASLYREVRARVILLFDLLLENKQHSVAAAVECASFLQQSTHQLG